MTPGEGAFMNAPSTSAGRRSPAFRRREVALQRLAVLVG